MTQSCYVQLSSSDMMSSSMTSGGMNDIMMSNSMIMMNNGSTSMAVDKGRGGRSRATAWNEYANNSRLVEFKAWKVYMI